jgi:hypothetical protein
MPIDSSRDVPVLERKARCCLLSFYDGGAALVWNSYAALFIFVGRIRPQHAGAYEIPCHFGAVMKDHSQKDVGNPYSPLMCLLLLLIVGAATQIKIPAILF